MKFALLSHSLPPSLSGQAMIIYRLLRGLDPRTHCLLSRENYDVQQTSNNYTQKLSARYYWLPQEFQIKRGYRFGLAKVREFLNVFIGIVFRGVRIARIIKKEKCEAIIACTGDLVDLPAAYVASKLVGVRFYPYLFDYYAYQYVDPVERYFAPRFEPWLIKHATGIISPNEFMKKELERRYGVDSFVIRNPCDLSDYEGPINHITNDSGEIKIVYTGTIYEAHFDAFRNLVAAIARLAPRPARLHLFTPNSPAYLAERGIQGPIVNHGAQPLSLMPGIQRSADILFLPLSFNSPYPQVIKTSATSKLGEYLASKRPILVHAPPDSFLAWYFRQHDCGLIVDKEDPALLARAIEAIVDSADLQKRLCANAWERAVKEFSSNTVQIKFCELMRLDSGSGAENDQDRSRT